MSKILVVDDEIDIQEILKEYAEFCGIDVEVASDGMEAVKKAREADYDLIIMDIMMPKLDGFSAIKEIRKTKDVPVICLSARGEEYDKLHAFELNVDDYVTKPFSPNEVMARIKTILRRNSVVNTTKETNNVSERFCFGTLEIDEVAHNVRIDGEKIVLTPKEYELLFYLTKHVGVAISREKLLGEVWGFDYYGDDRTVDTHIKMLRANLGKYRDLIVTLRGLGYKFDTDMMVHDN